MKRSLGCCYYPEHWPEEIWAEDARRMVEAGLSWVRIGEFAWSRLEPEPGRLDWGWLDRAIDVLGAAGLRVVLGTPTATPPRWLLTCSPSTPGAGRAASARAGTIVSATPATSRNAGGS
jgi:beta-galactosidase